MSLEKLPVPTEAQITLLASDFGSVFQTRMNAVTVALRNAIIAFNAQIDAAQTASQQVEPAPLDVAIAGTNNSYKITPLLLHAVINKYGVGHRYSKGALPVSTSAASEDTLGFKFYQETTLERMPFGSGYGALINIPINSSEGKNYGVQMSLDYAADEFGFRRLFEVWGQWCRIYHSRNIVGFVSQSAGYPTGSAFQWGQNPNGYFELDAAGNIEIMMTPTIDASLGSDVIQLFTLPTALLVTTPAFALTPNIQSAANGAANEGWSRAVNSCMLTMQSTNVVGIVVTSQYAMISNSCTLIIKGRWY